MEHTELWDKICKTDPKQTKAFGRTGGFKGTAIKPYWLIRRATEEFGVIGIGWGWEELQNVYVAGVWCSRVRLWYYYKGKRGQIEQWGQTQMENSRKDSDYVDEEAPKKAVTDAVSKCLSYLGFGADVHMGKFDDSKYVAALEADRPSVFPTKASRKEYCRDVIASMESSSDIDTLNEVVAQNRIKFNELENSGNEEDLLGVEELRKQYKINKTRLQGASMDNEFRERTA